MGSVTVEMLFRYEFLKLIKTYVNPLKYLPKVLSLANGVPLHNFIEVSLFFFEFRSVAD